MAAEHRRCTPMTVGDVTITPVARVSLTRRRFPGAEFTWLSIRPTALKVQRGEDSWVLRVPGNGDADAMLKFPARTPR